MIANIRGASGAGKSHLVYRVLTAPGLYEPAQSWFVHKPLKMEYSTRKTMHGGRDLAIIGYYRSATGGADTIREFAPLFSLIRKLHDRGYDTLVEGLLLSHERRRTFQLHDDGYPLRLFYLNIPLNECLASIMRRRDLKGNRKPVNAYNTMRTHRQIQKHPALMRERGIPVEVGDRRAAEDWLKRLGFLL